MQNAAEQNTGRYFPWEAQGECCVPHIVGSSEKMRKVLEMVKAIANSSSTVLIQGESGTGKELVAKAIHQSGSRWNKPFVEINCSALSEGLLESELFGHEKGAFTGAVARKRGMIESADGGVLFLDEIGEISLCFQVKLLRVLQEKKLTRVGGIGHIAVDFRLIAATNRDLRKEVTKGNFREDLYYRLSVITIKVPPLRDRKGDIPHLASYFLRKYTLREGKRVKSVAPGAMDCLMEYDWPGNVRELENCIERAVVVCGSESIETDDIPEEIVCNVPYEDGKSHGTHSLEEAEIRRKERELILAALEKTKWNKSKAARLLNMHRRTLYNRLQQYHLE